MASDVLTGDSAGDPFGYVHGWARSQEQKGWWHSFELPDGTRIDGVKSLYNPRTNGYRAFPSRTICGVNACSISGDMGRLVQHLSWNAAGPTVVAVDDWDNPRFREVHARLGSHVEYRTMDVYDLHSPVPSDASISCSSWVCSIT